MDLIQEFGKKIKASPPSWLVRGVLTVEDEIYGFGTDTKILSRVFELLTYPYIKEIADEHGLKLQLSLEQTVYPDFTLYDNEKSKKKIAIDVKTTYRRKGNRPFGFTLGSYTSFLRNNTKNILYPYDQYAEHWIIGFVYDRTISGSRSIERATLKERNKIMPSYSNVEFFVQEKYKIAGKRPGSGNTKNIGSILSNEIDDFRIGLGPFARLGEKAFHRYWASYPLK